MEVMLTLGQSTPTQAQGRREPYRRDEGVPPENISSRLAAAADVVGAAGGRHYAEPEPESDPGSGATLAGVFGLDAQPPAAATPAPAPAPRPRRSLGSTSPMLGNTSLRQDYLPPSGTSETALGGGAEQSPRRHGREAPEGFGRPKSPGVVDHMRNLAERLDADELRGVLESRGVYCTGRESKAQLEQMAVRDVQSRKHAAGGRRGGGGAAAGAGGGAAGRQAGGGSPEGVPPPQTKKIVDMVAEITRQIGLPAGHALDPTATCARARDELGMPTPFEGSLKENLLQIMRQLGLSTER